MSLRTLPVLLAALAGLALPPGAQAQAQQPYPGNCENMGRSKVTTPGPYAALPQEVVEVKSKLDGRPQQIGLIRPALPEGRRSPVIVHASTYHYRDMKDADIKACARFLVSNYVQHGYTVALVPTRGTGDSDGCPNLFGPVERSDLDDVLTWLGTQPWSNGRVGMIGISYSGSTPWVAAASGNPYLKTIVPASGVNDLFDLTFGAGTLDSRFWLFVPGYYHYYGPALHNPAWSGRDAGRTVNAATTCPDLDRGLAATAESLRTGEHDKGGYWAERSLRPMVEERYEGSVLLVQGMTDWNVRPGHTIPWAVSLRDHGIRVHQVLGQWNHQYPDNGGVHGRWDWADRLLAWWDHELKGGDAGALGPRVEVEDSSGKWRREQAWPPENDRLLHLSPGGRLTPDAGTSTGSAVLAADSRSRYYFASEVFPGQTTSDTVPVPGPVDETCAAGCATFRLAATSELRISGLPEVELTVTPTGPSGHVTAFLYRKHAGGLQRLGFGMTDLRFPRGENRSEGAAAKPMVPGTPMRARIELEPLEGVVGAGEELLLVVGQGRTGQVPAEAPAPVQLALGAGKSTLSMAVVDPPPGAFFTPPPEAGRRLGA
jgi:putative CocE/NonD family hydrolase